MQDPGLEKVDLTNTTSSFDKLYKSEDSREKTKSQDKLPPLTSSNRNIEFQSIGGSLGTSPSYQKMSVHVPPSMAAGASALKK